MRTAYALTFVALLAGSAAVSSTAGAAEVCDKSCVGPACRTDCVREPDVTVGRKREGVVIEERQRTREPGVEIRRERGPDVEIERR
jgi:hypothetical protein